MPIRNFAYLFSENADGMRLTRALNHLVTLIGRRRADGARRHACRSRMSAAISAVFLSPFATLVAGYHASALGKKKPRGMPGVLYLESVVAISSAQQPGRPC